MAAAFKVPNTIIYGEDALKHLETLKGKKAILVTGGSSMKRFGFLEKASEYLKKGGLETEIFDGVEPNPSVKTVIAGAEAMKKFNPDWIIAIGGGSAIDAAKVMWAFYEYPELTFEDIIPVGSIPELRKKAKFAAIPSTSGTASEITAFSVITDTENHIKYPIVSAEIVPDVAIIDPEIPSKMPPHITANTGMDVLAHSVEAYVSKASTSFTDPLAKEAISLIDKYLVKAFKKGDDMKAREGMHNASALAGMAFSNCSLGLVHSLAHKIGGEFGITHGLANAILMPYIIQFNKKFTDKYADIEKLLGVDDLAAYVKTLNTAQNIPLNLKDVTEVEITEEKFIKVLDRMSDNAHKDPCTLTNPGDPAVADVKMIYESAFYGKDIK